MKTRGISPKAVAALVWPVVVAAGAAVASWVVSGDFNDTEIRTAVGGAIAAVISFVGAYVSDPGDVVPE
jgi:hypothetical protein